MESQKNSTQETGKCQVDLDQPYPPIAVQKVRRDYGYAMLSNIGSETSEMSAVSRYFYSSVVLNEEYQECAQCLRRISIVEMHHLHIFASLSLQLGVDPRLWSLRRQRPVYWSPAYNKYPREIRNILEISIREEEETVRKYTAQLKSIQDENIRENLSRIVLDEQQHIKILQEMRDQMN